MRADDLFGDFALLPASVPELIGNKREAVPTTREAAEARFRCITLGCDMQGSACASSWSMAAGGAANRPSCRGCAAGEARAALLAGAEQHRVPPPIGIPEPRRRAAKCRRCGMLRDQHHTPTTCDAASAKLADTDMARRQAAVDRAQRRKARAEADRRRARAESEGRRALRVEVRRAAIASAVAALESGGVPDCDVSVLHVATKRVQRAVKAKVRSARSERLAAAAIASAARAEVVAAAVAAVEAATGRKADGRCMRAGGCQHKATRSPVGPFCARCMSSARTCLAKEEGASIETLRAWLLDLSKRAVVNGLRVDWSTVDWSLSNAELARALGCTPPSVRAARRKLGAPPSPMRGNTKLGENWDAVGLGERPDRDVAAALGVSVHAVAAARRARGVAALDPRLARKRATVEAALAAGLGLRSDAEVAHKLGMTRRFVASIREKLGIPPAPRRAATGRRPDIDWDAVGLGTIPDERIAATLGVSPTTVRTRRMQRGIPIAPRTMADINWEALDWASLSDRAIASALRVDSRAVKAMREKLGKPRPAHARGRNRRPTPNNAPLSGQSCQVVE